jgi:endonuclease YncB( thermonuclease family)
MTRLLFCLLLSAFCLLPSAHAQTQAQAVAPVIARYESVQLVRVVDGDTLRLNVQVEPGLWRMDHPCRLLRFSAPERYTQKGKAATAALDALVRGRRLTVEVSGRDHFGRWLIELYAAADNVSVNVSDKLK